MYNVLIVDDERIIREGIANELPWEKLGLSLSGLASNGKEGLEFLRKTPVDVAIIDIKMPVLNGLDMVETARSEGIQTEFIILSGYDDFEYAHKAMKNGVKYFLLKPTGPDEIIGALKEACEQIKKRRETASLVAKYEENSRKLKSLMKEQFLRDGILGRVYSDEEKLYYRDFLEIKDKRFSAVVLQVNTGKDPGQIFLARSVAEEYFGESLYLCTIIHDLIYFVIDFRGKKALLDSVRSLIDKLKDIGLSQVTATFKQNWDMMSPASSCNDLEACIRFRFWVPDAEIITPEDVEISDSNPQPFAFHSQPLLNCLRCGDFDTAKEDLDTFFNLLLNQKSSIDIAKFYSIRLYLELLNSYRGDIADYMDGSNKIQQMKTLQEVRDYIVSFAFEMAEDSRTQFEKKSNKKIDKMIQCIEENLGNEELSLKWLSNNLLYFNNDYLGKLFKKEMGVSFTSYVIKRRIERACELFKENPQAHVYAVAEKNRLR